jgi:hypothetical protein
MTYQEAEEKFFNKLMTKNEQSFLDNPPKIISVDTYRWGWIFHFDSKAFIDEGDYSKAYLPSCPMIVDKIDGAIQNIAIGHPFFDNGNLISDYEISKGYDKLSDDSVLV